MARLFVTLASRGDVQRTRFVPPHRPACEVGAGSYEDAAVAARAVEREATDVAADAAGGKEPAVDSAVSALHAAFAERQLSLLQVCSFGCRPRTPKRTSLRQCSCQRVLAPQCHHWCCFAP